MMLIIGDHEPVLDLNDGSDSLTIRMGRSETTLDDPDRIKQISRNLDIAQLMMRRRGKLKACPVCGRYDEVGYGRDLKKWYVECRHCGIRTRSNPVQSIVENDWNALRRT